MDGDYYLHDLRRIQEIDDIDNKRYTIRRVKFNKCHQNPLKQMGEKVFREKYRYSRATAIYIVDLIKNDLVHDLRGGAIPSYLQVLITVRTCARGAIHDNAGDLLGLSQPQVSIICKQVALALVARRAKFIKMQQNDGQNKIIMDFYAICGFRQVIGAIDCTHIQIQKTSNDIVH